MLALPAKVSPDLSMKVLLKIRAAFRWLVFFWSPFFNLKKAYEKGPLL